MRSKADCRRRLVVLPWPGWPARGNITTTVRVNARPRVTGLTLSAVGGRRSDERETGYWSRCPRLRHYSFKPLPGQRFVPLPGLEQHYRPLPTVFTVTAPLRRRKRLRRPEQVAANRYEDFCVLLWSCVTIGMVCVLLPFSWQSLGSSLPDPRRDQHHDGRAQAGGIKDQMKPTWQRPAGVGYGQPVVPAVPRCVGSDLLRIILMTDGK